MDHLPIDFSKIKMATDSNGQIQVEDQEQLKQIEQVVDIYYG